MVRRLKILLALIGKSKQHHDLVSRLILNEIVLFLLGILEPVVEITRHFRKRLASSIPSSSSRMLPFS
jgi:hypothetical protein